MATFAAAILSQYSLFFLSSDVSGNGFVNERFAGGMHGLVNLLTLSAAASYANFKPVASFSYSLGTNSRRTLISLANLTRLDYS